MSYKSEVIAAMKEVFSEVPYGIEHTLRVLTYAEEIAAGEHIAARLSERISVVAVLHDIGAVEAQRLHGSMDAPFQEQEGPAVARRILEKLQYPSADIERVCYMIAHHHTPSKIDAIDFQILWEADLIDNLTYTEAMKDKEKLKAYIDENFTTATGRKIAYRECIDR